VSKVSPDTVVAAQGCEFTEKAMYLSFKNFAVALAPELPISLDEVITPTGDYS
jgi:hypothetical protein